MKKYLTPLLIATLAVSCGDNDPAANNTGTVDSNNVVTDQPDSPAQEEAQADDKNRLNNKICYASFRNKDVVLLSFTQMDSLVTGDLAYSYYEKDRNKGTIKGVMRGDTLIADYNFESEGIMSVREVVFLKKDDNLVEGFGDVVDDRGKMIYKDRASLTFDNSLVLKKVNCEKQEQAVSK